jgi:hypothetical protein
MLTGNLSDLYVKIVWEISSGNDMGDRGGIEKTDEKMGIDRREARRKNGESSFRNVSIPVSIFF